MIFTQFSIYIFDKKNYLLFHERVNNDNVIDVFTKKEHKKNKKYHRKFSDTLSLKISVR